MSLSISDLKVETLFFRRWGQKLMLFPKLERFNLHNYKYKLRLHEFSENTLHYSMYYYQLPYTTHQFIVDMVLQLQFWYDDNNTKFQ